MPRRHPPPRGARLSGVWLFTDERAATPLARLAALLPPGSGIVVRHDGLAPGARWRLFRRLARIARARHLSLLLAGPPALARRWGADGVHLRRQGRGAAAPARRLDLVRTMAVHDRAEARAARRAGAQAVFVSPLHPTRSHPGAPTLSTAEWLRLARLAGGRAVALGGMTPARARALRLRAAGGGIAVPGWAAIDAWDDRGKTKAAKRRPRQKRNAVPT
ncbi:thiamine phosphate synthase [Sphingopyxis granuli]|uniref:thiamine phosphate synthase n=1 Tax=Sphingopyxis granuli TaxID=267128 RepID=UPI00301D234F